MMLAILAFMLCASFSGKANNFETGGTNYQTLALAAAAVADGGTITMRYNVTVSNNGEAELSEDKTYTINLNGKTLGRSNNYAMRITAAIAGVTAPAAGETPVTAITETAHYTGTVSWSGNPSTFDYATVYTATITLAPKAGYTLTGVTADYFTVAGATTVTTPANSGVITATFPQTEVIENFSIGGSATKYATLADAAAAADGGTIILL
jgi:hypothetical protein